MRIIGPGRAGRALGRAVAEIGWSRPEFLGRDDQLGSAADGVEVLVIATPDDVISDVSAGIAPSPSTVVIHLAGSLGLDVVARHPRHGALHPLVALPDEATGSRHLLDGAWFAVAGDQLVLELVEALGGRHFKIDDQDRALYHAAAAIASNHLVALLGQVERVAATADVPFEAMLHLVKATIANVEELGPGAALTGPAARGDEATISRHLDALPDGERSAYEAMVAEARRLAGRGEPTKS